MEFSVHIDTIFVFLLLILHLQCFAETVRKYGPFTLIFDFLVPVVSKTVIGLGLRDARFHSLN